MKSRDDNELLQKALRHRLTPDEEAQLEAYFLENPEAQALWEEDVRVSQLLHHLPDAPVASNFTAQVLALAAREQQSQRGTRWWRFGWSMLWPAHRMRALGFATLLLFLASLGYHQYRMSTRAEVARSVAEVFTMLSALSERPVSERPASSEPATMALPTLEMLENFEAIQRLDQVPIQVDVELLVALEPSLK